MKQSYDFTAGPIGRPLLLYTLPLLLANVLQSFYQLVDLLVVGRIVGETGLAAISSASTVCFLITSLGTGLTTGGMVRVAQQAGAKDTTGLEETAGTLFSASLVVSLLVAVAGALTAPCLLQLLSVPSEAMTDASAYLRVLCLGTPLSFGYLAHSAFRKGTGDAKVPLLCIAAAAAINLLLDLLLVGILALGTVGAAYATVASQGASLLLSLSLGRGQDGAVSRRPRFTLRRQPLAAIVKIGLPTALQMVVVNLSYCVLAGMCNTFGVSVAAAAGIGLKVNTLVAMPCWSLGQAVTAMVGQNAGAGAMDRVRKITCTGLWCGLSSTLILLLLVHRFSLPILQLFGSDSPEVLSAGVLYFQICCGVNSLFYTAMYLLDSFAIGLGHAKVALVNALLDSFLLRLPVCWCLAFPLALGYPDLWIGQAISPLLPALIGGWFFHHTVGSFPAPMDKAG